MDVWAAEKEEVFMWMESDSAAASSRGDLRQKFNGRHEAKTRGEEEIKSSKCGAGCMEPSLYGASPKQAWLLQICQIDVVFYVSGIPTVRN